jgi:hypothetical protein
MIKSFVCSEDLNKDLKEKAAIEDKTMSAVIRTALKEHLKNE